MTLPQRDSPLQGGAVLAFVATACFSLKAIFVKLAYRHGVDAVTLLALRMAFAAPLLLAGALWSWRARPMRLARRDWLAVLLLGFLGYYLSSLLDFLGLQFISAGLERLILFLFPTIVALISVFLLRKPIGRRGVAALILSYLGIAVAVAHDVRASHDPAATAWGSLLVFGCTVTYALYIAGSGEVVGRLGALRFAALATLVASLCVLLQFLLTRPLGLLLEQAGPVYLHAAAMAVIATVLPVFLTAKAIETIGAARVAIIGAVGPIATILFAALLLGEAVTLWQGIGAGLVLAGVMLVARRP